MFSTKIIYEYGPLCIFPSCGNAINSAYEITTFIIL